MSWAGTYAALAQLLGLGGGGGAAPTPHEVELFGDVTICREAVDGVTVSRELTGDVTI